jgi:hypothetical protein
MSFPTESKEKIYSDICAAGVAANLMVVPEFKLHYQNSGQKRAKWADIAWIFSSNHLEKKNAFPHYQVVAVFEVDGFDVPLPTIELYSIVYPLVRQSCGSQFPCYVPLYSRATHRAKYGINPDVVQREIHLRRDRAAQHFENVTVCDGGQRTWLDNAAKLANTFVHSQSEPLN